MFPDIAREDVFRLETRRLWLRWPIAADATTAAAFLGRDALPEAAAGDPYPAGALARLLGGWRDTNTGGHALHLVMTGRGPDRRPLGALSLAPIRERIENCGLVLRACLGPEHRGQGLMTEAVQGIVDAAFMLTDTCVVAASARVLDPAFRRVLEKCGFAFCGTGLDAAPNGSTLTASDRFRLDRKAWGSLKTWRVPGVLRGVGLANAADVPYA